MDKKGSAANRAREVDELLRRWHTERKRLLSLYCSLSRAVKEGLINGSGMQKLDRFREILIDYVTASHVEAYVELVDPHLYAPGATPPSEVTELYRKIVPTTGAALDFNDRCRQRIRRNSLAEDLKRLGEVLASRFDWEDSLVETLHPQHRQVA
jgi:regulator of sigma D